MILLTSDVTNAAIEQAAARLSEASTVEEILAGLVAMLGAHLAASVANSSIDLKGKRGIVGKVLNVVRVLALDTGKAGQRPDVEPPTPPL